LRSFDIEICYFRFPASDFELPVKKLYIAICKFYDQNTNRRGSIFEKPFGDFVLQGKDKTESDGTIFT